jgi:hypothetical protein
MYIVERFHPVTGSHEIGIGAGSRIDNSVASAQLMTILRAAYTFHPQHVTMETFTMANLMPLTSLRYITVNTIQHLVDNRHFYLAAATGARIPADWVGSHRNVDGKRVPRTTPPAATNTAGGLSRPKYARGGHNVYKEEDWVVDWWRQQPDGDDGWAAPFLDVVEQLTVMTITSAMVERLWSIYNASLGAHGHSFGPGERARVTKARFNAMYAAGL